MSSTFLLLFWILCNCQPNIYDISNSVVIQAIPSSLASWIMQKQPIIFWVTLELLKPVYNNGWKWQISRKTWNLPKKANLTKKGFHRQSTAIDGDTIFWDFFLFHVYDPASHAHVNLMFFIQLLSQIREIIVENLEIYFINKEKESRFGLLVS